MKWLSIYRLSVTSLLLSGISAMAATILSVSRENNKSKNGMLAVSDGGLDPTCTQAGMGAQCTDTVTTLGSGMCGGGRKGYGDNTGSRTTEAGNGGTSLMTATDGINCTHTITTNPRDTCTSLDG